MENTESKPERNIPITILLSLLVTGSYCTFFFLSWKSSSMVWVWVGLCFGTIYLVSVLRRWPNPRRGTQRVMEFIGAGGWFAYLASEYLQRGRKVSAVYFAVFAIFAAQIAVWMISGRLASRKETV